MGCRNRTLQSQSSKCCAHAKNGRTPQWLNVLLYSSLLQTRDDAVLQSTSTHAASFLPCLQARCCLTTNYRAFPSTVKVCCQRCCAKDLHSRLLRAHHSFMSSPYVLS
jgi:hypothetical protein